VIMVRYGAHLKGTFCAHLNSLFLNHGFAS
jgi:hypothetical protein